MPALAILVAGCLLGLSSDGFAQAKPGESLDQELLRDLGGDTRDALDQELFGPETSNPGDSEGDKTDKTQDPKRLRQALDEAGDEESNPLLGVARRMHDAGMLLRENKSGAMTRNLQEEILTDLDRMIEQAKKSACKQPGASDSKTSARTPSGGAPKPEGKGGGGKPNDKAAAESSQRDKASPSRKVDPEEMRALMKRVWGDLPERARQQVQQLPAEAFLPKYETLIEDYFRRLSEAGESDGGPQ